MQLINYEDRDYSMRKSRDSIRYRVAVGCIDNHPIRTVMTSNRTVSNGTGPNVSTPIAISSILYMNAGLANKTRT